MSNHSRHAPDIDNPPATATAAVCSGLELYGGRPGQDEPDNRPVWDHRQALCAIEEAFTILAEAIAEDGTQLEDERESLLWGFVNMLHVQMQRLDRAADQIIPKLRELERTQDGSEIASYELERLAARCQALSDRRDAFEIMRDHAAAGYAAATGSEWRPRHGSHTSRTGKLTSARIDSRDFRQSRDRLKNKVNVPQGTLIAVAGGREATDIAAIQNALAKAKAKHPDMVLAHGGGPGAERVAERWAENNGVDQIVCKPDWDSHKRAAPFRRNDELLSLLPKGLIAFPGSGITDNLTDKARRLGIPVYRVPA